VSDSRRVSFRVSAAPVSAAPGVVSASLVLEPSAKKPGDGSITFSDVKGKGVSRVSLPLAFEDVVDEHSQERVNESAVGRDLAEVDASSGAGDVALFTGEFATSDADASAGGLSVSRSHASFDGDSTTTDTGGDATGQVKAISATLWDPAASAITTTELASYTYDSAGRVTDVFEPRHDALSTFVSHQGLRKHTKTAYDAGAPNGNVNPVTNLAYGLPTSQLVYGRNTGGADVGLISHHLWKYDPIETGDKSGWVTGQATQDITREVFFPNTANDIITRTRHDARGRVVEVRQPLAASSASAGTTRTVYYTTGAHSEFPGCGN
jgi:hypothetical protein